MKRFEAFSPDEQGKRIVPAEHVTADGFRLGKWQENQRQAYKKGQLSDVRAWRLERKGIVWDPNEAPPTLLPPCLAPPLSPPLP